MKMTVQEFKEKQEALDWTNSQMAKCLGVSMTTVSWYRTGRLGIPIRAKKLLAQANRRKKHDNIKSPKMTPQEFKEKQKALGWNNSQMADYLGVSLATVKTYRSGKVGIPITITKLLAQTNKHNKHDNIKTTEMTSQEFKEIQEALGLDNNQMAKCLGVFVGTVSHYRRGIGKIPRRIILLLELANKQGTSSEQERQYEDDITRVQRKTRGNLAGVINKWLSAPMG